MCATDHDFPIELLHFGAFKPLTNADTERHTPKNSKT